MSYRQVLKTRFLNPVARSWWNTNVRQPIIRRAAGMCEICSEEPIAHIHHTTYKVDGKCIIFWEDKYLEYLIGVCPTCHEFADWYRREFGRNTEVPESVVMQKARLAGFSIMSEND